MSADAGRGAGDHGRGRGGQRRGRGRHPAITNISASIFGIRFTAASSARLTPFIYPRAARSCACARGLAAPRAVALFAVIFYRPAERDRELLAARPVQGAGRARGRSGGSRRWPPTARSTSRPTASSTRSGRGRRCWPSPATVPRTRRRSPASCQEFVWNLVTCRAARGDERDLGAAAAGRQRVRARRPGDGRRRAWWRRRGWPPPAARWSAASSTTCACTISTATQTDQHLVIGQVVGVHLDESAIVDGVGRHAARCTRWRASAGPADYAARPGDLPDDAARLVGRGLPRSARG